MVNLRYAFLSGVIVLGLVVAGCTGESNANRENPNNPATDPTAGPDVVSIAPGDDWQLAVDSWPEGTTFEIKAGVHRLIEVVPKDGNSFIGERGAIMNGSKLLAGFVNEGDYWVAEAGVDGPGLVHGECGDSYEGCWYPQDLFLDDVKLWRVTDLTQGEPGTWYLDYEANRVYVWNDPTNRKVELSVWDHAFVGTADNVTITGLVIEKYASPAQWGAIHAREEEDGTLGENWVVEQNEIRLNHGAGIRVSPGMQVLRNSIHHNGQIGIRGGDGDGIVIEGNEIAFNNTAGFSGFWEAGGTKFLYTQDLVVRSNHVHDNNGPGLWTDVDNDNTLYENNNVESNSSMGIQHEISFSAVIRNNLVRNNGANTNDWLWGAQIMVSGSTDVEVYGNTVVSPPGGQGIAVQQDFRLEDYITRNVYVHHNDISGPGVNGADENPADPEMYETVRFDYNTYSGTQTWFWNGAVSWEDFQAAGQEQNGSTDLETASKTPSGFEGPALASPHLALVR